MHVSSQKYIYKTWVKVDQKGEEKDTVEGKEKKEYRQAPPEDTTQKEQNIYVHPFLRRKWKGRKKRGKNIVFLRGELQEGCAPL